MLRVRFEVVNNQRVHMGSCILVAADLTDKKTKLTFKHAFVESLSIMHSSNRWSQKVDVIFLLVRLCRKLRF